MLTALGITVAGGVIEFTDEQILEWKNAWP